MNSFKAMTLPNFAKLNINKLFKLRRGQKLTATHRAYITPYGRFYYAEAIYIKYNATHRWYILSLSFLFTIILPTL